MRAVLVLCSLLYATSAAGEVGRAWTRIYKSPPPSTYSGISDIILKDSGFVYVTGGSEQDDTFNMFVTILYDPAGEVVWKAEYRDMPRNTWATGIARDSVGNLYLVGGGEYEGDFVFLKYDASGALLWDTLMDGPSQGDQIARDVVCDSYDRVYITGFSEYGAFQDSIVTFRVDGDGTIHWKRDFPVLGRLGRGGLRVRPDTLGNIYVAADAGRDFGLALLKYDSVGALLWAVHDTSETWLFDMEVDPKGSVYASSGGDEYVVAKYNSEGAQMWRDHLVIPNSEGGYAAAVTFDRAGHVYATGGVIFPGFGQIDVLTVKYDSSGQLLWYRVYAGAGGWEDEGLDIAVDDFGHVFVSGFGEAANLDVAGNALLLAYDENGALLWTRRTTHASGGRAPHLRLAADGTTWLAGSTQITPGGAYAPEFLLVKYVPCTLALPRGNVNGDGSATTGDIIHIINYLFKNGPEPKPFISAGDVNCDGVVQAVDALIMVNYLFKSGLPPCDPCDAARQEWGASP